MAARGNRSDPAQDRAVYIISVAAELAGVHPQTLEVLRTRVGDCNEHTALYVALARWRRPDATISRVRMRRRRGTRACSSPVSASQRSIHAIWADRRSDRTWPRR